jgi:hypothetical protein
MTITKLYNPDGTCPKCGYDQVSTKYCEGAGHLWGWTRESLHVGYGDGEFFIRKCERCGHQWAERPDKAPTA